MTITLAIDSSVTTHLAMCSCGWRTLWGDLPHAWLAAARHAKAAHGDTTAGRKARLAALACINRRT